MLLLLASALVVASCQDPLVRAPDPDSLALSTVQQQTGLRLTYLCGNRFRIRTTRADTVRVRWDVYGTADTGSVLVPGVEAPATQRDVEFETRVRGTTRIFLATQLIDTKANGGAACTATALIPRDPDIPVDTPFVFVDSAFDAGVVIYRRQAQVTFKRTASDDDIRGFLARFGAQIVAGNPDTRFAVIRFPDPGPRPADYSALLRAIRVDPVVLWVLSAANRGVRSQTHARFPDDGTTLPRSDWFQAANVRTWALRAVRANAAWFCENGLYGDMPAKVGIIEERDRADADILPSRRFFIPASVSQANAAPGVSHVAYSNRHAAAVTGVLTATGDNETGVAGVMWRTRIYSAALSDEQGRLTTDDHLFNTVLPQLADSGIRVLNLSTHFLGVNTPDDTLAVFAYWRAYLQSHPRLLVVTSAGNTSLPPFAALPSYSQVAAQPAPFWNLFVFSRLKAEGFRNVMIVGGSARSGGRYPGSAWVNAATNGGIDVAAPAEDVYTLGHPSSGGSAAPWSGTSFAAPLVAGAAAAAFTMDSSLTAAEVRDLIVASARDSTVDEQGRMIAKAPVHDGVYQLDVYNLLRRVAARSPTLPVCGQRVVVDQAANALRIERAAGDVVLPLPPGTATAGVSVAPGGRRIATAYTPDLWYDARAVEFTLGPQGWSVPVERAGINQLHYVDGDTLLVRDRSANQSRAWSVERRGRRPVTRAVLDVLRNPYAVLRVRPDPSGRFVYARMHYYDLNFECRPGSAANVAAILPVDAAGGADAILRRSDFTAGCNSDPIPALDGDFAWASNGESGWHFDGEEDNASALFMRTRVRRYRRDGAEWLASPSLAPIEGRLVLSSTTSLDGGRISLRELDLAAGGRCRERRVAFHDLTVPAGLDELRSDDYQCSRLEQLRVTARRDALPFVHRARRATGMRNH